MRRALGWLVPGHCASNSFSGISDYATPFWLQRAVEAVAGASADARGFASLADCAHPAPSCGSGGPSNTGDDQLASAAFPSSPVQSASTLTASAPQHLPPATADPILAPPEPPLLLPLPPPLDACTAAEPSLLLSLVQHVANSYEFVHSTTGLPWAASIPLTTLALRLALLPLSMRQARIIRTNYSLYKEAVALTDQQAEKEREERQLELQRAALEQQDQERWRRQRQQRYDDEGRERLGEASASTSGDSPGPVPVSGHLTASVPEDLNHHEGTPASQCPPKPRLQVRSQSSAEPPQQQQQQQQQQPQGQDPGPGDPEAAGLADALHARLLQSQAVLANFHMLRRKCDVPHPVWIVVNPLVQIPVFVTVSATLGMMCRAPWPGLSREGALWFPDLTQPAVVMATGDMPLGAVGLALPLIVYGMTMTSLRLGFRATGAVAQQSALKDTALGAFLRSLPPLLYAATTLNLYFKVQMAHGVLLHWLGSAGFTLSLQMALRNPALRALLRLKQPGPGGASLPSTPSTTPLANAVAPSSSVAGVANTTTTAAEGSSSSSPSLSTSSSASAAALPTPSSALPPDLVSRVAETTDPNVLVIMGAQLSARQHYAGALHCFQRAVLLKPGHVRAHYSMGQVYSLTGAWADAELSYRAAAELSDPGPERGQALYCVATALHTQGKLAEAAEAYGEADGHWCDQTVIAYGRANALVALGRHAEALEALAKAEARDERTTGRPFRPALARLRDRLTPPQPQPQPPSVAPLGADEEDTAAAATTATAGAGDGERDGNSTGLAGSRV